MLVDKRGQKTPFVLNSTQRQIMAAIRDLRSKGIPPRLVVLKARQVGCCLEPSTPVLTADLRWVPISSVRVGDALVGLDEFAPGGKGPSRKMRVAVVEAHRSIIAKRLRIVTDRGEITATPEHRFLVKRAGRYEWCEARTIRAGNKIRMLTEPWPESSHEDGWFGGMIDGEGHLRGARKKAGGSELSIAQLPGPVLERAHRYLLDRGVSCHVAANGSGHGFGRIASKLTCHRTDEIMRIVGQCRPTRYVAEPWWRTMELPGKRSGAAIGRVLRVESAGRGEMVDLQTSTKTFIANGMVSHNSTLVQSLLFHDCLSRGDRSALVVAHTMKSSKVLFRMSRNFHRFLMGSLHQERRIDNVHEIEFDSGSRLQVEVQGDPRGYTAQMCHISEFGFLEQPEETLTAILQTVPHAVDSIVVIESTANGVGNKFHKLWQRAVGLSMDSEVEEDERGWTPIFIPWFQHEEYEMPIGDRPFGITNDEHLLMKAHPQITREKLKWRRWCISSNLDGDEDKFQVEYPSTAEEAFSLSGRPAFDTHAVAHYTRKLAEMVTAKKLPIRQEIESDPPGIGEPRLVEYDRGRLRIFFPPEERHTYIVGVDPSEGDPGSDHSPLAVLDQQTMNLAATWYGKAPPDVLACHAIDLARYYRNAEIINEANNHGILFHETVRQIGYEFLYYRKVSEDSVAGEVTEKPGYLSTQRNREHLFNTLRKYVRMRMGEVLCPHMVQQMQSLVYIDDKAQAQAGQEKDLLVAFALCLMCHRGSMNTPLEPHPLELMRATAQTAQLLREREGEAAARNYVRVETGMTMEAVLATEDAILAREARQKKFGLAGMR